ncbi:MAG: hypothetical protein H6618_06650 [Deltaproteobacteria bacterium]|nr:hypothetical protein [Deltaproteobacteria bacterium]
MFIRKLAASALGFVLSFSAISEIMAKESCYEVSTHSEIWNRTPDWICIGCPDAADESPVCQIILKRGLSMETEIGRLQLEKRRTIFSDPDKNTDYYGMSNPDNATFSEILTVLFDGKITHDEQGVSRESGTVIFADKALFYRKNRE